MRRREAFALLAVGLALVAAGLTWLFGPYGLIGAGLGLAAFALIGAEVRDDSGEALGAAAQRGGGARAV